MHEGYWTVFSGQQAVICCKSFDSAWTLVYALSKEIKDEPTTPPSLEA